MRTQKWVVIIIIESTWTIDNNRNDYKSVWGRGKV